MRRSDACLNQVVSSMTGGTVETCAVCWDKKHTFILKKKWGKDENSNISNKEITERLEAFEAHIENLQSITICLDLIK